ncbi:synaptic plasticity regulator PANTS [Tribolium castaneum]|uniref:synaptic plasticity regulator PANTS n=1 Tax=Tribolium castaneum TaxID=7070 RepID=UPI0030FEC2C2
MTESNEKNEKEEPKIADEWLIRPCPVYEEEYKECSSLRGRFHQYFIFGETLDCISWKRDYDNCCRWRENKDVKSAKEIIENEKRRRKDRLVPHFSNDVWPRRTSPPDNWNSPLPEHIQKEYETSYLNIKSKELKGEIPPQVDISSYCTLM